MSIGLEEILGLLFFVFFFVVPLISKKNKPPTRGTPPAKPPTGGRPAAQGGLGGGPVAADAAANEPSTWRELLQEVRRRVAEAEAAQTEAGAGGQAPAGGAGRTVVSGLPTAPDDARLLHERTSRPLVTEGTSGGLPAPAPRGLVASDPFTRGLVTGDGSQGGLGREGHAVQPRRRADEAAPEAAPLQVTRLPRGRRGLDPAAVAAGARRPGPGATARLNPAPGVVDAAAAEALLKTGRDDLVRGMMWHEILSEPVAARRLRRARSRHQ